MTPVHLNTQTYPVGHAAPFNSRDISNFNGAVVSDLASLQEEIERLRELLHSVVQTQHRESEKARRQSSALRRRQALAEANGGNREMLYALAAVSSVTLPDIRTLYTPLADDETILSGSDNVNTPSIDSRGGYASLRQSRRTNLLAYESSGEVVVPSDITFALTVNESGGRVKTTDLDRIVRDRETEPWYREVRFPATSSVSRVSASVTIGIPSSLQSGGQVNLVEVVPHPAWLTAIDSITLLTIDSEETLDLDSYGVQPSANGFSIPVSNTSVTAVRINISSEAPYFQDGEKIFNYGLKKVGLYKVSYAQRGDFVARFSTPDARRITSLSKVAYNLSRPALRDYLIPGTNGIAPLHLKIEGISENGRELIYDSATLPEGEITSGPISFSEPFPTAIEVTGSLHNPGGGSIPPRIYDLAIDVYTESESGSILNLPAAAGGELTAANFIMMEEAVEAANGARVTFNWTSSFRSDKVILFVGGRAMTPGDDYVAPTPGTTVSSLTLVDAPETGESVAIMGITV